MENNLIKILEELLFLPLDLPELPTIDPHRVEEAKKNSFLRDDFRNCFHIPIFNTNGSSSDFQKGTANSLQWTPAADVLPEIKHYILNHLQWMSPMGRAVIICTPPKTENPIHLDCTTKDIHQNHIKFRAVLQGTTSSLWFWDGQQKHPVKELGRKPFLMSGKFPHGMTNDSNDYKYTLAIGSPWDANPECIELKKILEKSLFANQQNVILKSNIRPPELEAHWLAK